MLLSRIYILLIIWNMFFSIKILRSSLYQYWICQTLYICLWTIAVNLWIWISFYYAIIITFILLTTYSIQILLYQYIISVQIFNHDFQFQLFVNYNMEFVYALYIYYNGNTTSAKDIFYFIFKFSDINRILKVIFLL